MSFNPFVFGSVVTGENFTDREDELKELTSDLTSRTNVIIFSPRRYGKTSLMIKVMEELRERDIICIYIDLFPATSKARFVEIFATSVTRATAGKIQEIVDMIKEYIPGFKFVVRPEGEGVDMGIEIELAKNKKDLDDTLNRLYDLPQKIADKKKKKIVVVFDEFQEIVNIDGDEIERSLRTKIQHHKSVSYVFMGSRRHLLEQIFSDKNKPMYRIGKPFNLGKIPSKELSDFIKNRFRAGGVSIGKEVIDHILQHTETHPYYTQQLCHEIWNVCQAKRSNEVAGDFVDIAAEQVMKNQNYAYTSMWDATKGKQRSLLMALAVSDKPRIYSVDFRNTYHLGAASTVEKAAKYLEEKGLIDREDDDYLISDIFFKEWLKRMRGAERIQSQ